MQRAYPFATKTGAAELLRNLAVYPLLLLVIDFDAIDVKMNHEVYYRPDGCKDRYNAPQ